DSLHSCFGGNGGSVYGQSVEVPMKKLIALPFLLAAAAAPAPQPAAPEFAPADAAFVAYSEPVLLFEHVELVDGTGAAPRRDVSVLVRGGRIAAIGANIAAPV